MEVIGYEFLRNRFNLPVFPVTAPASIRPTNRVRFLENDGLQVPRSVAPKTDDPVDHLLFALRYEAINLQILSEVMQHIDPAGLAERFRGSPSGLFIRQACYLWETFTRRDIIDVPAPAGGYGDIFDPEKYITGAAVRSAKWRINFNGIGSPDYCPVVRRSPLIRSAIASDILGCTQAFLESLGADNADRALAWAYLSETDSSFAIERESPSASKAEAFVALLQEAHEKTELTEDYLSDLQSSTISNPFERAACFRHEQNWLRGGPLRGASSVTYIPPPPELLHQLMPVFLAMANHLPRQIDPIVAASVTSFGFVYLHPFMDGNGRLSRFLFHHSLCQSGRLAQGRLLPVSIAMKRHEDKYLAALQSFSKPARRLWEVSWTGDDNFILKFDGTAAIYRFWDATPCVEFGLDMAAQALDVDLRRETEFLMHFDHIKRQINDIYDVRDEYLHTLIVSALQNQGEVSKNRRKQYLHKVPDEVMDFIQSLAKETISKSA